MQRRAPDAECRPAPEQRLDLAVGIEVADSGDDLTLRVHAKPGEPAHGRGHQSLAARLVDWPIARLRHGDRQPTLRARDRCGQPGRAAADDQDVDHGAAVARALVSHRSRTVSSQAFRAVNVSAVIQAEPISGSAAPSTTTAT